MDALNGITDGIMLEAKKSSDEIIGEANRKAAQIKAKAEEDRAVLKKKLDEESAKDFREISRRADSANRQKRRQALLGARNKVINEVVAQAKAELTALPDKEYFDLMFRIFEKNACASDGILCFAPSDRKRIPGDFIRRCRALYPDNSLELSEDDENIRNGFVIKYGDIIQNCSLDGIFEANNQLFRDKANEVVGF